MNTLTQMQNHLTVDQIDNAVLPPPALTWLSHLSLFLLKQQTASHVSECPCSIATVCWERVTPVSKLIRHSQVKVLRSWGKSFSVLFSFWSTGLAHRSFGGFGGAEQHVLSRVSKDMKRTSDYLIDRYDSDLVKTNICPINFFSAMNLIHSPLFCFLFMSLVIIHKLRLSLSLFHSDLRQNPVVI